jgi:Tfp pilus assembly protein PilN
VRAVNLLPRDAERTRSDGGRAPLLVLVGGLAAVTATTIFLYFSAAGTVSERRGDLEAAREAVAAATPSSPVAPPEGLVVQERADRVAALAAALSSRVPLDVLLRQIAYVLPTDAWLTGLQASSAGDDNDGLLGNQPDDRRGDLHTGRSRPRPRPPRGAAGARRRAAHEE